MATKVYTVKVPRRGRENIVTGTLDQLIKYYGYTLEIGNSWNSKINRNPKTFASFVSNYNKSVDEKQGGCYERDYMYAINPGEEGYGENVQ